MFRAQFAKIVQLLAAIADIAPGHPQRRCDKKNVTGIAAIHYSLRDVDSGAGDIGSPVYIGHFVDGPTVNSHAYLKFRVS